MRTITTAQQRAWESSDFDIYPKVEISDGGIQLIDWTDLFGEDWVFDIEIREDIDQPGRTATVGMAWRRYNDNASPYTSSTRISGYLDVNREIIISFAIMPEGVEPSSSDYIEIFRGTIGKYDFGSEPGTIEARDQLVAELQDRFVEAEQTYGGGAKDAEDVITDIIADHTTSGLITVDVPTPSSFAINEYKQSITSVLQAVQDVSALVAWDLRSSYNESASRWGLLFYAPARASSTAVFTFDTLHQLDMQSLEIDMADIRNIVKVTYVPITSQQEDGDFVTQSVTSTDSASVSKYGRRWMEIVEGSTSRIDTLAEAQDLADAIVADLSTPIMKYSPAVAFFPWVEVNDIVDFEANGRQFAATQTLAVQGYTHTIGPDGARTQLMVTGRPKSGQRFWTDRQAQPGKVRSVGALAPPIPATPTISTDALVNRVVIPWPDSGDWDLVELHRSTSSGFTPDASTLIAYVRGGQYEDSLVTPGTTYYYKTKTKSLNGQLSAPSTQASAAAAYIQRGDLDPEITAAARVELSATQSETTAGTFTVEWDTQTGGQSAFFDSTNFAIELQSDGLAAIYALIAPGTQDATAWSLEIEDANTGDVLASTQSLDPTDDLMIAVLVKVDSSDLLRCRVAFTGTSVEVDSARSYFAASMSQVITT